MLRKQHSCCLGKPSTTSERTSYKKGGERNKTWKVIKGKFLMAPQEDAGNVIYKGQKVRLADSTVNPKLLVVPGKRLILW